MVSHVIKVTRIEDHMDYDFFILFAFVKEFPILNAGQKASKSTTLPSLRTRDPRARLKPQDPPKSMPRPTKLHERASCVANKIPSCPWWEM
jgi:hypothetical protein